MAVHIETRSMAGSQPCSHVGWAAPTLRTAPTLRSGHNSHVAIYASCPFAPRQPRGGAPTGTGRHL
jgi:hypothetical protein